MSNILKAKVLSPKDATEAKIETKEGTMTVFKFIGTKNNIENAKALMDYLVNSHNELDLLMVSHPDFKGRVSSSNYLAKLLEP